MTLIKKYWFRALLFLLWVFMALFYLSFHELFAAFGLFINRQVIRNDHPRGFVVSAMVTDSGYDKERDLYDASRNEFITKGKLIDQLQLLNFNVMDSVQVDFKKGLFDVDYYDAPKIYKKLIPDALCLSSRKGNFLGTITRLFN